MTEPSLERMRTAVTAHRGGWADASEDELRALWLTLPDELRQQYLSVAVEEVQHSTPEVTTPTLDPRREATRGRKRRPSKQPPDRAGEAQE